MSSPAVLVPDACGAPGSPVPSADRSGIGRPVVRRPVVGRSDIGPPAGGRRSAEGGR
ncbi:hypothetical protein AB0442_24775 [Kitasatospora sp. NPDC085895]|uniref:hypothetical protein n=1 Tax=Kitasatospora sp. NPDC085895 TaxID=3155057 RepID=UPI00344D73D3